jgi:dienelactone hydrolase
MIGVRRVQEPLVPGEPVPAWELLPERAPAAGAVLFHGYGSRKEALLGLALRLAEAGLACLVPDLPGHGEHPRPLGEALLDEARAWVRLASRYGKVVAAGHSLGGRLALLSGADVVIALSPALPQRPSPEGMYALTTFPTPKVRQERPGQVVEVMQTLPPPELSGTPVLIALGKGDIPGIVAAARELAASLPAADLAEVEEGMLGEVPEPPPGFARYLPHWLNHGELPLAAELASVVLRFLRRVLLQGGESRPKSLEGY